MAPKKKKKPASNPARGFATVSLPSKAKIDDGASEAKNVPGETAHAGTTSDESQSAVNSSQPLNESVSFHDMTADQVEIHFEDAELQNIMENSTERSKREAARQVVKLETERRNLRAQAMPLETDDWLTEDLVEQIFNLHLRSDGEPETPLRSSHYGREMHQDDLLVKLWTLQQVLRLLHFPHEERVLKYVVSLASDCLSTSKDYIWGLEESLDWLSLHSNPEELPSYQSSKPVSSPFHSEQSAPPSSSEGSRATSPKQKVGNGSTMPIIESATTATPVIGKGNAADDPDSQLASSTDADDSSDDDDNDPDSLVSRYINTKLRLLKLRPEFQYETSLTGDSEHDKRLKPSQVSRLCQRVETIERDILFDHEQANAQLNETLNQFRAERLTPKPLAGQAPRAASSQCTPLGLETVQDSAEGEDTADGLFGDMFTSAEPFLPTNERTAGNEDDGLMLLVDFGKWVGVSPRKVLEDTCKTRDPGCEVSFHLISSSTYSNRHRVQIKWSRHRQQDASLKALPPRVSYQLGVFTFEIEMRSIATSTVLQSEAYVSTIALFALCAGDAKDEKVFLRLPPIWRNLWADLVEQRQAAIASSDKSDLTFIRRMINDRESRSVGDGNVLRLGAGQSNHEEVEGVSKIPTTALPTPPEQRSAEWIRQSSSPRYQAMLPARQQLPIFEYREGILQSLENHQVTIVCAETGAGKSTQVPAYILEYELSSGRNCRVLVTQPRRISAMSLARRVSEELGEARTDIGTHRSLVGYAIRLESKTTSSTRLTYATTGVLLRMLEDSRELDTITHLVLDEVHERTLDLDLAFIAIKRLLARRPGLKVLLMSATVDAGKFSTYFANAPILTVPGRTYPVEVRYLEDAVEHIVEEYGIGETESHKIQPQDPDDDLDDFHPVKSVITGLDHYGAKTRAVIASYDEYRIDYALITKLVAFIAFHATYAKYSRAILIFLPGIAEIWRLHHTFVSDVFFREGWSFNLLHSSFSSEDLEAAFKLPPPGIRKVVIATNIAETGITIPDVTAVIDTCKEKTMRFDERRQMSKLTENFTSKSSCKQRRGRAARVQDGLCFHLITKYRFENLLPEQHVPEMLRLSLQEPALRVKTWGLGKIEEALAQALDPPAIKNIRRAVDALKDVKALTNSESLTPLGRQLARLPLDIWLGKLTILGIAFACLDAAVTIASIVSSRSPFVLSQRGDSRAESAKLAFKRANSDLLLKDNAYLAWRRTCQSGNAIEFCRRNLLDHQALSQIEEQRVQLLVALGDAGLLNLDGTERSLLRRARSSGRNREFFIIPDRYNINDTSDHALTSLIAQAFYPQLLMREGKAWRNTATNQQVNIAPTSINKLIPRPPPPPPPPWLSFHQMIQTKSKLPTVFDTSAVPESAIVIFLGDAEFRLFAGVIAIDGNKIRFRVRSWRTMMALKILRSKLNDVLTSMIQRPGQPLKSSLQPWANLWQKVVGPIGEDVKLQSVSSPKD